MYQLSFNETHSLLRKAESGMGYQVVDAQTMDYRTRRGVVFNAELLTFDEDEHSDSERLKLSKSYTEALRSAKNTAGQFRSLVVVPDSRTTVLSKRNTSRPSTGEQKAMEVERALQDASVTKEGDVFYRFSAFENDRRVTPEKRLLPGTYATTKEDGDKVKTGKEAVERYALPNPGPASYRFTIKPKKDKAKGGHRPARQWTPRRRRRGDLHGRHAEGHGDSGRAVHAPHDRKIIARPDRLVLPVRITHRRSRACSCE